MNNAGIVEALSLLDQYLLDESRVWQDADHIVAEILNNISKPLSIDELIKLTEEAKLQLSAKKISLKGFL